MKTVVQRVVRANKDPIAVEEVDISTSQDLEARYGLEIPVLLVDGTEGREVPGDGRGIDADPGEPG
jgi:Glutaredoxin-like domain (DUF836).